MQWCYPCYFAPVEPINIATMRNRLMINLLNVTNAHNPTANARVVAAAIHVPTPEPLRRVKVNPNPESDRIQIQSWDGVVFVDSTLNRSLNSFTIEAPYEHNMTRMLHPVGRTKNASAKVVFSIFGPEFGNCTYTFSSTSAGGVVFETGGIRFGCDNPNEALRRIKFY